MKVKEKEEFLLVGSGRTIIELGENIPSGKASIETGRNGNVIGKDRNSLERLEMPPLLHLWHRY